jgi:hypothetical protein
MKTLIFLLLISFSTFCQKGTKVETPNLNDLFEAQNRAKNGYSFDFLDYIFITATKSNYIDFATNYEVDSCLKSIILSYGFESIEIKSRDQDIILYKVIPIIKEYIDLQRSFLQRIVYQYVKIDFENALNLNDDENFRDIVIYKIMEYKRKKKNIK